MRFCIHALLERLDADTAYGFDEALAVLALLDVQGHDLFKCSGHIRLCERRADHLADGSVVALATAQGDLVPLLAVLIDAQNADIADVMVTTGVHAAGKIAVDVAQI